DVDLAGLHVDRRYPPVASRAFRKVGGPIAQARGPGDGRPGAAQRWPGGWATHHRERTPQGEVVVRGGGGGEGEADGAGGVGGEEIPRALPLTTGQATLVRSGQVCGATGPVGVVAEGLVGTHGDPAVAVLWWRGGSGGRCGAAYDLGR